MKPKGKLASLLVEAAAPKVSVKMKTAAFYVKLDTYNKFHASCTKKKLPMSHVIEAFMLDFIAGNHG